MGILSWIIIGGIAGWIGSMLTTNDRQMGCLTNVVVGIIGSFIGGYVFSFFGGYGVTGFNVWSLVVAVIGSVIFLTIINLFRK